MRASAEATAALAARRALEMATSSKGSTKTVLPVRDCATSTPTDRFSAGDVATTSRPSRISGLIPCLRTSSLICFLSRSSALAATSCRLLSRGHAAGFNRTDPSFSTRNAPTKVFTSRAGGAAARASSLMRGQRELWLATSPHVASVSSASSALDTSNSSEASNGSRARADVKASSSFSAFCSGGRSSGVQPIASLTAA